MDPFTQRILAKAEQRSRIHGVSGAPKLPLNEFVEQSETFSNNQMRENKTAKNTSSPNKSGEGTGSPSKIRRQYSVDKENMDVGIEINITTKPNVEVQVGIEEQTIKSSDNSEKEILIRDSSRNRLHRLGALYSNADNLSSPIHRTENNFYEDSSEDHENISTKRPRQRIGKLAELADSIKNWEDDTSHPNFKNDPKHQPHQQPESSKEHQTTSESDDQTQLPSVDKSNVTLRRNTKHLKWDKSVIDSLEAQGFQRRESSTTKLSYNYCKENSNPVTTTKHTTAQIHNQNQQQKTSETTNTQSNVENVATEIKSGLVSSTTAAFEKKCTKSPLKQKDPAEMSLRERMMLFEKNKGQAPVPKVNFPLPRTPIAPKKLPSHTVAGESRKHLETSHPTTHKPDLKDFPVNEVKLKDKVAALLAGPSTISEAQIKADRTKQLKEDMNVLANRFNVRKEVAKETSHQSESQSVSENKTSYSSMQTRPPPPPPMPSFSSNTIHRNEHVDAKCTISNKRRSPGIATSDKTDDSSAKNSSDDAKRVKVNPIKKPDRLYPVLSDLESIESDNGNCTTATMSTPSIDDEHNRYHEEDDGINTSDESDDDESYMEDDGIGSGNVSLGREIMSLVHSNSANGKGREHLSNTGDTSANNSSAATSFGSVMEEYLDEALDEDDSEDDSNELPDNKNKNFGTTSSNSFCYQKRPKKQVQYKTISEESENDESNEQQHHQQQHLQQQQFNRTPLKSELTVNSDENNVVTLVHTVSFYRRQQQCSRSNNSTPVKKVYHDQSSHNAEEHQNVDDDDNNFGYDTSSTSSSTSGREEQHLVQEKVKRLLDEVCKQQQIIAQTSQALNLCASTVEFSGSTEAVEGERHLLVASHRRQAALDEIQRLKIEGTLRPVGAPKERGRLSVQEIIIPLKDDYIRKLSADTISGHHLVCLLKYGEIVLATKTVPTLPGLLSVKFPDVLTLNNVYADFKITLEIYGMTAQREILPHEVKYHINLNNKKTPKKKGVNDSMLVMPRIQSPAGPHVVRTPALVQYGFAIFSLREIQRDTWTLTQTSGVSPLKGTVHMKVNCELSVNLIYKGFLTMFEDISGFGAWHRRWCYLNGHVLNYWKYPDDEKKKTPMGSIDLYTCSTSKVTTVPRDICARLNTLLLECQRPAKDNDTESLLIVPKGKITIVRHLLSADTKEERDEWCAHFNKALTLLRAWNSTTSNSS